MRSLISMSFPSKMETHASVIKNNDECVPSMIQDEPKLLNKIHKKECMYKMKEFTRRFSYFACILKCIHSLLNDFV